MQCNRTGGTGLSQTDVACNSNLNGCCPNSKLIWQPPLAGASHQVSQLAWHQGDCFVPSALWKMSSVSLQRRFLVAPSLSEPAAAPCNGLCKALSSSSLRAGISPSSFSLPSWAMLRQPESVRSHSHTNAFRSAGRLSSLPCTTYSSTWQLQRRSCWGRSRTLYLLLALGKGFWGIAETEFPFRTKFGSSPVTLARGPARPRAGTYLTYGSPGSSLERLWSSTMNSRQMNVLCHGAVTFFLRLLHIAFLRKKSRILK